jgi:hypothetical protein
LLSAAAMRASKDLGLGGPGDGLHEVLGLSAPGGGVAQVRVVTRMSESPDHREAIGALLNN